MLKKRFKKYESFANLVTSDHYNFFNELKFFEILRMLENVIINHLNYLLNVLYF